MESEYPFIDPAALVMLASEIAPLSELRDWQPVQELVDLLLAALRGQDGISAEEVDRLRSWTYRWQAVPLTLRAWWSRRAPQDRSLSAALWSYLQGRAPTPQHRIAARIAWRDDHGWDPYQPMLPGW